MKLSQKFFIVFTLFVCIHTYAQQTQIQYLSGTGKDDTRQWQFYCTAGRNSGKWTTIAVPSCWELQGFGKYNYGLDKDSVRGKEQGLYKYHFNVPAAWKGKEVNIVFEGSMTDTEVKINGKAAGAKHQGSFYSFKYNISKLLKYGKDNLLEVTVSKHSANESVNKAERHGDFWIFGGIFRPVFLECLPAENISHVAVNALADGSFNAQLQLDDIKAANTVECALYTSDGKQVGNTFNAALKDNDTTVTLQAKANDIKTWTPEFPNLYKAVFTLKSGNNIIHTVEQKFGFRTVELRPGDGIYLNGIKIKFKGVCHHSFWPSSGRTTSKALSIADVQMMKDMNMNAVRMSHYPPDAHFLDACDSLGLMVLDELTGWHQNYDTEAGSKLVKEMIAHDVNHPSIVIWDNGNEGGFNFDLDHLFDEYDIQHRPLIHPWAIFRHTDTQHYINYDYGNGTHAHGHEIFFPTEFLHGLYDGGHGAGLDDYWNLMWNNPLSAGGFLWVFADEGVVRTDRDSMIDNDKDHAPDGIVGPYHEKEGSYYTIKEIWSPVYVEHREITPQFDGKLTIENRYFFTNINQCSFSWKFSKLPTPYDSSNKKEITGKATAPDIKPEEKGTLQLQLPKDFMQYDVLYVTASDPHGREIYTWSFPVKQPADIANEIVHKNGNNKVQVTEQDSLYVITANNITFHISRNTAKLVQVKNEKGIIPFTNGPQLTSSSELPQSVTYHQNDTAVVVEAAFKKKSLWQQLRWTIYPSGWIQLDAQYFPAQYEYPLLGINFHYPEANVKAVEYLGNGPYRVWKNRMKGTTLNVWDKQYNNTSTGEDWVYPEFKGYYSNFYWMKLITTAQPITIVCASEDIFLRLFTPKFAAKPYNTAPPFPDGDISFMHAITPIGTKSQKPEKMGPSGEPNMYYDYGNDGTYSKNVTLYFNLSGE
ncbi:glycoside hydrolase family 2 [Ilyomonas limi]|uniref:beta-galactosidase n=1 Tax=Ilyomonas limi TaxID=2575867 RepID=A0A4U3KW05_9BACT|nr:glycoside hydrolase family 2 TIM barrel-domain containing protein [Ilyomonas limi]TKK65804.1 glycoside hydrolase family 2 [Ilyomonas limi]